MLTENFLASTSGIHQSSSSAAIKDASIFVHEYQPLPAIRTSFKKSATPRNCLAASASHIFAAQANKAVVHVYSREKGNQETLVPFPERIHSLTLAADGTILVLGTEGGRIFLWETCTGRQVATQAAHLQAVTTLVVDQDSNFLLSGSADSNIHVWSLPEILSWSTSGSNSQDGNQSLRRTLSDHRAAINSLILGHSAGFLNIAISTSQDNSCIVWNYQNGDALRTVLLPSTPLSLALDPADRCFYTGFEDGSVQLVQFYSDPLVAGTNIFDPSQTKNMIRPQEKDRWAAEGQNLGPTLSMDLSYDGMTLLTGHESGKVICWDVGGARFQHTLCDLHGPVTNLHLEIPTGFVGSVQEPRYKVHSVTKPRFDLSTTAQGTVPSAYNFTAQFSSNLPLASPQLYQSDSLPSRERFEQTLFHPSFPSSFLEASIAQLAALRAPPTPSSKSSSRFSNDHDADFLALDGAAGEQPNGTDSTTEALEAENQMLKEQMAALKRVQIKSFEQLEELRQERKAWLRWEKEVRRRELERKRRKVEREERRWAGEEVATEEEDMGNEEGVLETDEMDGIDGMEGSSEDYENHEESGDKG